MDKILELFIKNPEKEFHVRGISKLVGKSPTTVSKYLKKLASDNILLLEKKFNHLLFRANVENKKYKREKLKYNLDLLNESGLVKFLEDQFNQPEAIVLFGSFAKAENGSKSDIDILVISPTEKEANLEKYEKILGFPIQLFVNSRKNIEKMKDKNKGLLNNFINGHVLSGRWEIFR
jgi:predicted nucleotidyltransferase